MTRHFISLSLVGLVVLALSCKKTKMDTLLQPSGNLVATNSSIRLFNFYNFNLDVTVNNIPLTSYSSATQSGTQVGLAIFPTGSWVSTDDGNPFFVPNSLVTKDRKVHLQVSLSSGQLPSGVKVSTFVPVDTVLTDDPLQPNDYYALPTGHLLRVPRNNAAPVQPDHFKIRVINLGAATDPNDLTGAVRLTYSDGSSVGPLFDKVDSISDYIDLPYGAYMFKLFSKGDSSKQLTELPALPNMNLCSFGAYSPVIQQALFPRVRTFKPGATYSLVITQSIKVFPACDYASIPTAMAYNSYRIITEQSPGPNTTYAQLDAVNALPVKSLSVKVDGQSLGGQLAYTKYTDYGIFVQGTHQVQAIGEDGTVLTSKSITLSPYGNYTAWIYQNADGHPDICFANTDMTSTLYQTDASGNVFTQNNTGGVIYVPPVDDGTDGTIRVKSILYAWQTRFLNLTPDVPFVTFTNDVSPFPSLGYFGAGYGDSANFYSASVNLASGVPATSNPFLIYPYQCQFSPTGGPSNGFSSVPAQPTPPPVIRVFQSIPGPPAIVPGTLLAGVAPLPSKAYIARPTLYKNVAFLPSCEAGVYTTALIGKALTATSSQDAAQMIILKHYK